MSKTIKTMRLANGVRYYTIPVDSKTVKCVGLDFLRNAHIAVDLSVEGCIAIAHVLVNQCWECYYMTPEALSFYEEYPEGFEIEPGVSVHVLGGKKVCHSIVHSSYGIEFADPDWKGGGK